MPTRTGPHRFAALAAALTGLSLACLAPLGCSTGSAGAVPGAVTPTADPPPAASDALGLVAFVSTDGRTVYLWSPAESRADPAPGAEVVQPVHFSGPEWSVRVLALSASPERPYLAVAEAFDRGTGEATRVTIIDTATGASRRILPAPGFTPRVSGLKWSRDGRLLFVDGDRPLVLDVAEGGADLVWDLSPVFPGGRSSVGALLPSPDLQAVAFPRRPGPGRGSGNEGEDLFVVREDQPGARLVATGGPGTRPAAWLGAAADGSRPEGPYDYLLVELARAGAPTPAASSPAVVDLAAGRLSLWYPAEARGGAGPRSDEAAAYRVVLLDPAERRALINTYEATTGRRARTFWRSFVDGAETGLGPLDGRQITDAALGPVGPVAAVLVGRSEAASGSEIWAVERGGSCRRLAVVDGPSDVRLVGRVGAVFVLVQADPEAAGPSAATGAPAAAAAVFRLTDGMSAGLMTPRLTVARTEGQGD